jgi:hypothetical protein
MIRAAVRRYFNEQVYTRVLDERMKAMVRDLSAIDVTAAQFILFSLAGSATVTMATGTPWLQTLPPSSENLHSARIGAPRPRAVQSPQGSLA